MNSVNLIGRLTKDPEIRYAGDVCVARYTLAVDRKFKKDETDFIPCVVFRGGAEFAEKYLHKGMKIAVGGRIQTGSYTNKEGKKVYTTDIMVDEQEFVESKQDLKQESKPEQQPDFVSVPDDLEGLPFN